MKKMFAWLGLAVVCTLSPVATAEAQVSMTGPVKIETFTVINGQLFGSGRIWTR